MKCLTGPGELPVLQQLVLVQLGPSKHESELAAIEIGLDRLGRIDADLCSAVGVACVEVGRLATPTHFIPAA